MTGRDGRAGKMPALRPREVRVGDGHSLLAALWRPGVTLVVVGLVLGAATWGVRGHSDVRGGCGLEGVQRAKQVLAGGAGGDGATTAQETAGPDEAPGDGDGRDGDGRHDGTPGV